MPHKHNAARRHHIPKMSFKVQNWPAYEAGLRQRGSLTLWIEDGAPEDWQTCGQGGQARYTDAAILTSLMLRTAFKLPLRQTEGLIASVLKLMDLTISAPDHATVSRRAVKLPGIQPAQVPYGALHVLIDSTGLQVYGAGQWLEAKHGANPRRKWRKLHLAVDACDDERQRRPRHLGSCIPTLPRTSSPERCSRLRTAVPSARPIGGLISASFSVLDRYLPSSMSMHETLIVDVAHSKAAIRLPARPARSASRPTSPLCAYISLPVIGHPAVLL
jgi:hypothetical protein